MILILDTIFNDIYAVLVSINCFVFLISLVYDIIHDNVYLLIMLVCIPL